MKFVLCFLLGFFSYEIFYVRQYRESVDLIKKECNQKVIDAWKIYRGVDIEATTKTTR